MEPLFLASATAPAASRVDMVRNAAAAGFAGVGLRFDREAAAPGELAELSRVLRDTGLGVLDIEVIRIGNEDPAVTAHLFDAASALSARTMLTVSDIPDRAATVDRLGELADEAASRGADVVLVTTSDIASDPAVRVVRVETAAEMQCAVEEHAVASDVIVMTAAVADFRPVRVSDGKWKKENGAPRIELEPTPDILAGLGAAKRPGQVLVGFAAETENVEENARGKMIRKNLDIVVSNDVSAPGVGFGHDTNEVVIHLSTGACTRVPLSDKRRVAAHVLDSVVETRRRN